MPKLKGIVFYRGPSVLDGAPIVGIATMSTSNVKTGNMIQTWILRDDMSPIEAVKNGGDVSICGICPQRHYVGGACYVTVFQAPLQVWKAYKKGLYPDLVPSQNSDCFIGRKLRLGAYGDPAAIPFEYWKIIIDLSSAHTGYTHQLKHKAFDSRIASLCMISTDTEKSSVIATDKGYKTFRIKGIDSPLLENEIECLADSKGLTCEQCMLCNGLKQSVAISVHGTKAKHYKAA